MKKNIIRIVFIFTFIYLSNVSFVANAQVFDLPADASEEELLKIIQQLEKDIKKAEKKSGKSSASKKKTKKQLKDEEKKALLKNATTTTEIVTLESLEKKIEEIRQQIADFIASLKK